MSATALDAQLFSNLTTQTAGFRLKGGTYGVAVQGTFGQTVTFQMLGPDGSNYVSVASATNFTAAGYASVDLPAGQFRFVLGTATAIYAEVVRIPA